MYYPYFRGKQFELILLRENAEFLAKSDIHPIIEPVKSDFTALKRSMKALNEYSVYCTLVINPRVGLEPVSTSSILTELIEGEFIKYSNMSLGYILHAESNINELVRLLKKYHNFNFSILHYGYTQGKKLAAEIDAFNNISNHIFIDGFAGKLYQKHLDRDGINRVLIRDGFKPQKRNKHYPLNDHFSDLHVTFRYEGMDGFGDYLVIGEEYSETGGPAYAVAIHLTYLDAEDDMFIYHFVSDQTDSPTDPGGKFLEALAKLVRRVTMTNSLIFRSRACDEYLRLHKKQHYPGLGYIKKLSMQHHIELIADFLK